MAVFKQSAGFISTISPAVPFDPSQTYAPTTDFFNNRTIAGSSQLGLVIQRSARLSLSFSGGVFDTNRGALGLYGVVGETAMGDVQYRVTRRATIGANYNYSHYGFSHLISNSDLQGAAATFAYQLSRWWEFSGYVGFDRVETKFVQSVPVDPAVAAIIGITQSSQIVYSVRYIPNYTRAAFANLSQRRPLCERRPCGDTWKWPVSHLRGHDGQLADIPTRVYAAGALELIFRTSRLSPLEM